jgi:hypothetical protein
MEEILRLQAEHEPRNASCNLHTTSSLGSVCE